MTPLEERWRRLSRQQQIVGFIVGGLATIILVDFAALRPLRHRVKSLKGAISDAEQRLAQAMAVAGVADQVNKTYAAYVPYAKSSGTVEAELAGFLGEVESAVRGAGVTVLNLKPLAPKEGATDIHSLSVALEGESAPEALLKLLDRLQRSQRLLKVTELTVRVSEQRTLRSSVVISKLLLK